jgi:hypothetical protein
MFWEKNIQAQFKHHPNKNSIPGRPAVAVLAQTALHWQWLSRAVCCALATTSKTPCCAQPGCIGGKNQPETRTKSKLCKTEHHHVTYQAKASTPLPQSSTGAKEGGSSAPLRLQCFALSSSPTHIYTMHRLMLRSQLPATM